MHSETCLHEMFEAQVERTPDAIAVECEGTQLTYWELNRRANQLAHYLRALGVGPEVLVGLYVERSPEMLIALLGILKAGGAYVPLDVVYPQERLAYMLRDAQVPVLVTLQRARTQLPASSGRLLCLDTEWDRIARARAQNPVSGVQPAHLAAVLYTSGSTGTPKGVMIEHRSFVHYTATASQHFVLRAGDRILQFASISFDTAAEEIFPGLACGATLVLRTDAMLDVDLFFHRCHEWALTVLDLPTAYWHALTARLSPQTARLLSAVRLVIIGGERALWESLVTWRQHVPPRIRLVNTYGPTEATVVATMAECATAVADDLPWHVVPIGHPIRNVQTCVIDAHLQPVAPGSPGEICIGGTGVTRGYLNQPALTAERFLPDPWATAPGARLYTTGDLVRSLPDGALAFVGRMDHQVKIRGLRVELGEIEAALCQHPAVREAVVVAQEASAGEPRLVAYIVPAPPTTPSLHALRRFLQTKLPVYMLPMACVPLTALPLTPHGKVDRQRLPTPTWERPAPARRIVPPRDRLEYQLVQVWEQVLGIQPISRDDDFFALGGDSLLAVRLLEHIKHVCGQELPLAAVFQAPTVARLVRLLRQGGWVQPWAPLIPLHPHGTKPPFFWVLGTKINHALPRYLGSEQLVYGFMHQGADGTRARYRRVEDLAAHYLAEIRTVQPTGPYYLGGYSFGGLMAFEMAQQLHRQGQRVALLALLDPAGPRSTRLSSPPTPGVPEQLRRHLRSLTALALHERLSYLLQRVRGRLHAHTTMIRERCASIACEVLLSLRYPLPLALRDFYILDVYERAIGAYQPQSYPGRMVLFLTATTAPKMHAAWEPLGAGRVEVHVVPGDHKTILDEPQFAAWALLLREHLRKSQAAAAGI